MAEVHCYGAPMVRLTVEAQEAVADGNVAELKRCLVGLTEILMHIAYVIFARISQVETHETYVGGAFWAKIIGAGKIYFFYYFLLCKFYINYSDCISLMYVLLYLSSCNTQ